MRISLRLKLVLGLGAIMLVIGAGAVFVLEAVRDLARAVEEVKRREEAVRVSLTLASSLRDQYVHEAHVLLLPDPEEHVRHFEDASRSAQNCEKRIRPMVGVGPEQDLVDTIGRKAAEFRRLFHEELLPAFRRGDRERALDVHHHSEELLSEIIVLNDQLSGRFLAEINDVQAQAEARAARAHRVGAGVLLGVTALALAIGAYLARSITRPIGALVKGTEAIARGDFGAKIEVLSGDELGALARSFNDMVDRLAAHQRDLVRAERAASLGQLAAGVAHQINNPLGVILGYAEVLGDARYDDAARRKAAAGVAAEARECRTIVQNLMALARPATLDVQRTDVAEVVEVAHEKARRYAGDGKVDVRWERPREPLLLSTDARKLEQALVNVIQNALEAMQERGGTLGLAVRADAATGGGLVEVADTGPGIGDEEQRRLFDPYFTTKRKGTGLGLAFAHELVRALGGSIEVASERGRGTTFRLALPAAPPAASTGGAS